MTWPPASVWLLGLVVLAPPAGLTAYLAAARRPGGVACAAVPLGVAGCAVYGLWRRPRATLEVLALYGAASAVVMGVCAALAAANGEFGTAAAGLAPVGWAGCVLALRWWPETRRWGGEPPAGDDP